MTPNERLDALIAEVEAELVRHGFPTFERGTELDMWEGLPNEVATMCWDIDNANPIEVAREVMWMHDGTSLHLPDEPPGDHVS